MFRRGWILIVVLLACTARAQSPVVCELSLRSPYLTWPKLPVAIFVDSKLSPIFREATEKAVIRWNEASGQSLLNFGGESTRCAKESVHCVTLEPNTEYLRMNGQHDYGHTKQSFESVHWKSADVILNGGVPWARPASIGQVDPYDVILHELGHVLGLQHHFSHLASVMNYVPLESGPSPLEITAFDLAMLKWMYQGGPCPERFDLAYIDEQNVIALEEVRKKQPDLSKASDVNALYLRSRLERASNHYDVSMLAIDRALSLAESQPALLRAQLYNHRADIYYRKNNWPRARRDFEKSLKLAPANYQTLTYLAHLKMLMGESRESVEPLLTEALKLKPGFDLAEDLQYELKNSKDKESAPAPKK